MRVIVAAARGFAMVAGLNTRMPTYPLYSLSHPRGSCHVHPFDQCEHDYSKVHGTADARPCHRPLPDCHDGIDSPWGLSRWLNIGDSRSLMGVGIDAISTRIAVIGAYLWNWCTWDAQIRYYLRTRPVNNSFEENGCAAPTSDSRSPSQYS